MLLLLEGLIELFIGWNDIRELPKSFYQLPHLNTLDMAYAGANIKIEYPICLMRSIETLYIDRNTLNFAPRCLEVRANGVRFNLILR